MYKQRQPTKATSGQGRIWAGIIIIGIGSILLAGRLGFDWLFPAWIFNWRNMWPLMLIVAGLIVGGNSNFRHPATYILLGLAALFLARNVFHFNIGALIWPAVIIGIGIWLLTGRGGRSPHKPRPDKHGPFRGRHDDYEWDKRVKNEPENPAESGATAFGADETTDDHHTFATDWDPKSANDISSDDYLKSTAIFSEIKKTIISKRFKGGEIVNVCGGTDVNLIQADIQQPIVIDVLQLFAGTKIIVPSHWKIQSDVVSIFGEVNDRRFSQGTPQDETKVVYIKGTSLFGGITIKNI